MDESHPQTQPEHTPPPSVTIQWQRLRIGRAGWEDIDDPHERSPLADVLGHRPFLEEYDDGMGNRYRRMEVR